AHLHAGQTLPEALIRAKEEGLVVPNRSAQRAAKLIQLERSLRSRRPVEDLTRIEGAVAQILEDAAMQIVGARLRDDVDLAAGAAAVLRRVHRRRHRELLDRF